MKGLVVVCFIALVIVACHLASFDHVVTSACSAETKITAEDADKFGTSQFKAYGHLVCIGTNRANVFGSSSGAVYLLSQASGNWVETQKLAPDDGATNDNFGESVDIYESMIIVGAPQHDISGSNEGAAYLFIGDDSDVFTQTTKLTASAPVDFYGFGSAVAVSGTTLFVTSQAGVHVLTETSPLVWTETEILSEEVSVNYGSRIVARDSTFFANAPFDAIGGTVYVYDVATDGVRTLSTALNGEGVLPNEKFGVSLAVDGDTAAFGAYTPDELGVNADAGSVFIFRETAPGEWSQQQQIFASDGSNNDYFGKSVSLLDRVLAIGAYYHDYDSTYDTGAAYIFYDSGDGTWLEASKMGPSDAPFEGWFGSEIAISGNTVFVGSPNSVSYGSGAAYAYVDPCGTDADECASSPCLNAGICSTGSIGTFDETFECDCGTTGFDGDICQSDYDDCASSPCLNGGNCTDVGTNVFECECTGTGFEGASCQFDTDDCASSPCMHNGVCSDNGLHSFLCNCTGTGYEGDTCMTDVNDCLSSPCQNDGSCSDAEENVYRCNCTNTGYEGLTCSDDVDDCLSSPCQNDGVCEDKGANKFKCNCAVGFEGESCDVNINECVSSPCLNGAICVDHVANYSCRCSTGYEGDVCNIVTDNCLSMPCTNGDTCVNGVGDFTCIAPPIIPRVDPCLSSPCLHDGLCWVAGNSSSFICDCPDGYEGYICEYESVPQPYPIDIVIDFEDLLENVTLVDVIESLPSAVTASQDNMSNDQVDVIGIIVPEDYSSDELVENADGSFGLVVNGYPQPIPVEKEGVDYSVTIRYANSEQISAEEVERRFAASTVPDLTSNFHAVIVVDDDESEEEDSGKTLVPPTLVFLLLFVTTQALIVKD